MTFTLSGNIELGVAYENWKRSHPSGRNLMSSSRSAVELEISEAARPTWAYFSMSALSAVLASYGLLANSPAVIIGAMLVAMLLNPITALSMALVVGDRALIRQSLPAEMFGAVLVFSIGFLIGLINLSLPLTSEMLSRTDPSLLDLVIAIAGGAAGSYAIGNPRLNSALAGVAIATALVPPLANAGILAAHGAFNLALGSLILYAGNYAAIVLSAMVVFWLLGHRPKDISLEDGLAVTAVRLAQVSLFIVLAIYLAVRLSQLMDDHTRKIEIQNIVERELREVPGSRLIELRVSPKVAPRAIVVTVRTPQTITPEMVSRIEAALPQEAIGNLRLRVRSIPVFVANSDGYLFNSEPD